VSSGASAGQAPSPAAWLAHADAWWDKGEANPPGPGGARPEPAGALTSAVPPDRPAVPAVAAPAVAAPAVAGPAVAAPAVAAPAAGDSRSPAPPAPPPPVPEHVPRTFLADDAASGAGHSGPDRLGPEDEGRGWADRSAWHLETGDEHARAFSAAA